MNRALLAFLLAASVGAVAQDAKAKPADSKPAATQVKADKKAAPAPASAPAAKPTPAPAAKPAPAPAAKAAPGSIGAILANKDSKTYHRSDCKTAAKIKESNRTSFASSAEADKAGYKACKVCKP